MNEQMIRVQLLPGSRISIFDDVDTDEGGFIASTVFEDTVERHVPTTRLIEFADSDIGYAEFEELLEEHDSVQIVRE